MKLSFGIIGYGRMAEVAHEKIINSLSNAKVVAVCDATPARRKEAEKKAYSAYESLDQFLKQPELDAVAVVTPSNSHRDNVVKVLKAGKHVIVEKPMAMTARQVGEMIDTAKKNHRLLTVFHNRRYDADFLTVKKVIRSGRLGRILAIESRYNYWGSPASFGTPAFYQNWRNEKRWGGGCLYDWGSHLIDQMLQLVDSPVRSVYANMQTGAFAKDCDDYALGTIDFKNGICGIVEINYMTKYNLPRWRVIGEKATLVSELHDCNQLKIYDPQDNTETHLPLVQGDPGIIYKTFVKKILGKGNLAVDPHTVHNTMQVIDAFFESSRTKKSITFQ